MASQLQDLTPHKLLTQESDQANDRKHSLLGKWSKSGRKISAPLKTLYIGFFLFTVIGLSVYSAVLNYYQLIDDLKSQAKTAENFLLQQELTGTGGLSQALIGLSQNEKLMSAIKARDEAEISRLIAPVFAQMRTVHHISEFTIFGSDLSFLARAHGKDGFLTPHHSSLPRMARAREEITLGLEIGDFGKVVLSAARPYRDANGDTIGIIRLATNIDAPLRVMGKVLTADMIEMLPQHVLPFDQEDAKARGWVIHNGLALQSTRPQIMMSPELFSVARKAYEAPGAASDGMLLRVGTRIKLVRAISSPLMENKASLVILMLTDITADLTQLGWRILGGIIVASLFALAVGVLAFRMIEDLQNRITETQEKLEETVATKTRALEESRTRLLEAQRITALGSWERNLKTGHHSWSEEMYRITDIPPTLDADTAFALLRHKTSPSENAKISAIQGKAIETCSSFEYRYQFMRNNGELRTMHVIGYVQADDADEAHWVIGTTHDITEQYEALERGRWLSDILEASLNEIYVVDARTLRFQYANTCALENLQYDADEFSDLNLSAVLSGTDGTPGAVDLTPLMSGTVKLLTFNGVHRRKNGTEYPVETRIQLHSTGNSDTIVAICNDISERVAREKETQLAHQKAERLAYFDDLTNLPNRAACQRDATIRFSREAEHRPAFLLHLDIDNFKRINDTLGHSAGDSCLEEAGERLRICCVGQGTAYRWGGDEFVIIAQDLNSDLEELCERLHLVMRAPMEVEGKQIWPSVSIGAARCPEDGTDFEQLLVKADLALYNSKENGKDRWSCFTGDLKEQSDEEAKLELELRRAIRADEFFLVFQPQINLRSHEVTGLEALVRWNHPTRGVLAPGAFLPVIEKTNLATPLGQAVIEKAVRAASELQKAGLEFGRMAVNLSPSHLKSGTVMGDFMAAMERFNVAPEKLTAEVLESIFLNDTTQNNATMLRELHSLGLHIELDDFGTGFASLSHVADLPINGLKIDRSFTNQVLTDRKKEIVISHLIHLARALNINIVCEGVETEAQMQRLEMMGNFSIQGYLIARPMPFADLTEWLNSVNGDVAFTYA